MRKTTEQYFNLFHKTLDLPGVAWWVIDFKEDAKHFYCNDKMTQFFELDPKLSKHSIQQTCPITGDYNKQIAEEDQGIAKQIFDEYDSMLIGDLDFYDNCFPFFCKKTNKTLYFNNRAKVLETNAKNKPEIIYGIIEDITTEKEKTIALEFLSQKDPLTKLYNRLKIDQCLYEEVYRFKQHTIPVSIIFLDIDNFKDINDTFGHFQGDEVLVEIAEILKSNTCETDLISRWGGDEFLIICTDTNLKQTINIAKKLREKIETSDRFKIPTVTVSIGVTEFNKDDNLDSFLKRADKALYSSKAKGRNTVSSSED